ncbi:uncharacterized protein LOC113232440 isoform X2 [Hyposmocoma kahamanoa]|uniref:uncharacterized protein LOC113232440 isoform X2 n=1 Tax=Hyposmocoma kahamanoa TaxID=1477025 RepID=UPI000E6D61EE|nr:uncharacterized protein LOC113232440 isoform X2 [Hyposmocoma kahamanoa]
MSSAKRRLTFSFFWAIILLSINCSKVRDANEPKGIYLEEYCPGLATCPEGSHVLCMYYTPGKITGPRCYQPMNITMTGELAQLILDITNAIRSKIALGKETGKQQAPLPRAYGMNKLKWDNELATFAQVMANQCILRHDLCRASKTFSDPGQSAGLVRFTHPDWLPVSAGAKFKTKGLIQPKLMYAVTQALRSWYNHKDYVTPELIDTHPDFDRVAGGGKLYLQMVYAKATYMGCGIIGYTEYAYHDNNANLIYNSVQIICNFSARPKPGGPVYDINPPDKPGYTVRCGCPPGFDEDNACLCENVTSKANVYCDGKKCKPAVVLLPIFTVEDMPPKAARRGYNNEDEIDELIMPKMLDQYSAESFNIFPDNNLLEESFKHPLILPYNQPKQKIKPPNKPPNKTSKKVVVKPRHFSQKNDDMANVDYSSMFHRRITPQKLKKKTEEKKKLKKAAAIKKKYTPPKVQPKKYAGKKKSIFSIASKFTLPKSSSSLKKFKTKVASLKKQLPKIHEPINKHSDEETEYPNEIVAKPKPRQTLFKSPTRRIYTNNTLPNSKYKFLKNKFRYFEGSKKLKGFPTDITNIDEESDNKLMNLLDTLEQEVKHIELDRSEKQLFDAKLRKIYGSLVTKPKKGDRYSKPYQETTPDIDFTSILDFNQVPDDVESMNKIVDKQMSETEDRVQMEKQFSDKEYESKQGRISPMYAVKDQHPLTPVARPQSEPETNYKTITDEEPNYSSRKNTKQDFQKLKHSFYSSDDNMTPIDRTDNLKDRSRVRPDTYKERSIYRPDNFKFHEPYIDKKDYDRGKEANVLNRRFDSDNDIKSKSLYKNEDYNDYKLLLPDYSTDDANVRAKPHYDEENADGHLDFDRRRFYQEKLNKLERKMHGIDDNPRHATHQRDLTRRLMQSSVMRPQNDLQKPREQMLRRPEMFQHQPSKLTARNNKMDYYVPDRARSLHGF